MPIRYALLVEASAQSLELLAHRLREAADTLEAAAGIDDAQRACDEIEGVARFPNGSKTLEWLGNEECGYWRVAECPERQRDCSKRAFDLRKAGPVGPLGPLPAAAQWNEERGFHMDPDPRDAAG